jgi:peroxiredoxin
MTQPQLTELPDDLPVPVDDGVCAHMPGMRLPPLLLPATDGQRIDVAVRSGRTIVYTYPRTGQPGQPLPTDWDAIPGARGCTPEACGFRDHQADMRALDATVFGLSTQDTAYQQELVERLNLPFVLLSDADLRFATALQAPTFTVDGMTLLKRFTLVIRDGVIEHVFYPVFPPDTHAAQVLAWLSAHP